METKKYRHSLSESLDLYLFRRRQYAFKIAAAQHAITFAGDHRDQCNVEALRSAGELAAAYALCRNAAGRSLSCFRQYVKAVRQLKGRLELARQRQNFAEKVFQACQDRYLALRMVLVKIDVLIGKLRRRPRLTQMVAAPSGDSSGR